ncbi:glutamate-rich protein 1 isoform X2 [Rhinatrema bivittatum]|uniref:glutamate-rich protein 1 isoform X2 n=1 Tax=Rhinatrema bivittatum TaxID=194408 RepID=UPI001126FF72|nr:glutamate-rich protein 1 isoform X2 [Rhinatrema bivittatum]
MSAEREGVFIEKVLKRLYAAPSPSHLQIPPVQSETSASPPEQKDAVSTQTSTKCPNFKDGEKEIPNQKLYTVNLPPDGYLPCCPMTSKLTLSEHSGSSKDSDGEDSYEHPTRKHARKRQQKNLPDSRAQMASKRQTHLLQDNTDSPKMNKNKKRKMKKKRQKEKLKAAGLLTKASGVDFMYQPEENINEEADAEDVARKTSDILDFLQATQEIYFAGGKSKCADLAISSGTVHETLQHLKNHGSPSSDVTLLHKLKSLVLLQDIERLKVALDHFKEHSTMLPDGRQRQSKAWIIGHSYVQWSAERACERPYGKHLGLVSKGWVIE